MRSPIFPRPSPLTSEDEYSEQYANESSGAYQSPCANFFAGEAATNVSEMAHCGSRHQGCDEHYDSLPEPMTKADVRVHAPIIIGYNWPNKTLFRGSDNRK
jgi:succinyl-CoA synthetase alpha subunit